MPRSEEKLKAWETLIEEARDRQECVVCLHPLAPSHKPRVKCARPECLRGYHAMYRRLKRRTP